MILLKNLNDINSNFQDSITQNSTYEKKWLYISLESNIRLIKVTIRYR